jgi:hypothetical protein
MTENAAIDVGVRLETAIHSLLEAVVLVVPTLEHEMHHQLLDGLRLAICTRRRCVRFVRDCALPACGTTTLSREDRWVHQIVSLAALFGICPR